MKKKIIISLILCLLFITGCGKTGKGNCTSLECIKELKPEYKVEEINEVIGFEGELIDEKNNMYTWEIEDNNKINATYYNSDKAIIEAQYNIADLKDDKVDFSSYDEIQDLLKKGKSLTYEEFNEKVKSEGHLYSIGEKNKKYIWVNKDGEYINANFSTKTNKCTFVTGKMTSN